MSNQTATDDKVLELERASKDKHQAFKRLASQRTNAVLDKLRILGNCANRSVYSYSDDDIRKIFRAIEAEVKKTREKFEGRRERKFEL